MISTAATVRSDAAILQSSFRSLASNDNRDESPDFRPFVASIGSFPRGRARSARLCLPTLTQTTAPHGLTSAEIARANSAVKHMLDGGHRLYYAVLGFPGLDFTRKDCEEFSRSLKNLLTTAQRRAGIPRHWVELIEVEGGAHFNIIFPANREIVESLRKSEKFALCTPFGKPILRIERAPTALNLVNVYLAKEATPQAKYALGAAIGKRRDGSHRLEGGGDRVRLSKALKADCSEAGRIEDWKRTYRDRVEPPDRPPPKRKTTSRKNPEAVKRTSSQKCSIANLAEKTPENQGLKPKTSENPSHSQTIGRRIACSLPSSRPNMRRRYVFAPPAWMLQPPAGPLERVRPPPVRATNPPAS